MSSLELLQRSPPETINYDPEIRLYDDTTTWLAETLDGNMRTKFEYDFDGHELYGSDGSALKTIFKDSLKDAQKLAANQPNLVFELRRRWLEMGEYQDMIAMAKGDLPNTMVVVSDFPPELMEATSDVGGYNTKRKQTMLRVISRRQDGAIVMRTQSLDRSNRQALEAMYKWLSFEPGQGELLGQRLHFHLPLEEQQHLTDKLTGVYDRSLARQYGGEWRGGRSPAEEGNTYDFVKAQHDLVSAFVSAKLDSPDGAEELRYGLAAAMEKRFHGQAEANQETLVPHLVSYNGLLQEMEWAAEQASVQGKTFSGCGISVGANGEITTSDQLSEAGYGNKSSEASNYKFDKYMHCVVCQAPPKKDESKKMCGPCGICRQCDTKLKKE